MVRTDRVAPPIFGLRREIDKLFEDTFGNADTAPKAANAWLPAVDVKETTDALLFEFEIPGVAQSGLNITCEGGVLAVAGDKETLKKDPAGSYHIVERPFGAFRRSFQLPANVREDAIEASLTNGVLLVRVPKMEQPKPRKIEVRWAKS